MYRERDRIETGQQIVNNLLYLKRRYGLRVYFGERDKQDNKLIGEIRRLNIVSAKYALIFLREELDKYPPSYIHYCHPSRARLASTLTVKKSALSNTSHEVAGFEVGGQIYLVYLLYNPRNPREYRRSVHHELMHVSNTAFMFALFPISFLLASVNRANWAHLNPSREAAYLGGRVLQSDFRDGYNIHPVGFSSPYGQGNVDEDMATIVEEVMTEPVGAYRRAEVDTVFSAKIRSLEEILYHRSRGKMNSGFFKDLRDGKVHEGYWD